jgi:hypothetical protein
MVVSTARATSVTHASAIHHALYAVDRQCLDFRLFVALGAGAYDGGAL